ncbi:MAG: hypothetical protein ACOCUS_01720 [Polyangiales bacterium]
MIHPQQQPPPGYGAGPPQQMGHPPPQPPPQRKKGMGKGCVIALVVSGALVLVCGGVATWLGYEVYSNPEVQKVGRAVGEGIEVSQEAMNQPGTDELRAAGCDQAMVMLPEHMKRVMRAVEPDGGTQDDPDFPPMVICQYQYGGGDTLSCEQVATTYGDAITAPPAELGVQVQRQGGGRPICSGRYGPDGTRLGSLESGSRQAAGKLP